MAQVDIIAYPDAVSPIGNEILLKLQSNNRYTAAGTYASLVMTFSGQDTTAGHLFTISWANEQITFTLAASPDTSGNQLPVGSGLISTDTWISQLALWLARNYYIRRDFEITTDLGADTLTLTARERGTEYDITVETETLANVTIVAVGAVDPVARENYELVCLTDLFNGTDYDLLNEDRITPDTDGYATFDIHDLFHTELEAEHTWPEVPETYYALRENHIKKYLLHYAELYAGSVGIIDPYASLTAAYAILGAFDYKMVAALNEQEYTLLDYITTYKSFLTWQPTTKTISQDQPEKLYFLVFNDISAIEIHIKAYFTDGTDSGDQQLATIGSVSQYQVYEIMIGYNQIDWDKISEKDIEKYEIWLEDNAGNVQSQVRTYILETKSYRNERIFLFRNSFGAFDTLRATGRKTQQNEYERMILEKNDENFSLQQQYQVLERSVFTLNTGWLTLSERNWLRELLLSEEVYEIMGDYKFPVIITDEKREFRDDDNYLYSLEINYKFAFKDPVFSGDYTSMPLLAENMEILLSEDGQPLYA